MERGAVVGGCFSVCASPCGPACLRLMPAADGAPWSGCGKAKCVHHGDLQASFTGRDKATRRQVQSPFGDAFLTAHCDSCGDAGDRPPQGSGQSPKKCLEKMCLVRRMRNPVFLRPPNCRSQEDENEERGEEEQAEPAASGARSARQRRLPEPEARVMPPAPAATTPRSPGAWPPRRRASGGSPECQGRLRGNCQTGTDPQWPIWHAGCPSCSD